jgi:hypothetical protein
MNIRGIAQPTLTTEFLRRAVAIGLLSLGFVMFWQSSHKNWRSVYPLILPFWWNSMPI